MCRIVLMDNNRLLKSEAYIRMSDLPGCWHLFTHKRTFHKVLLVNDLAGLEHLDQPTPWYKLLSTTACREQYVPFWSAS